MLNVTLGILKDFSDGLTTPNLYDTVLTNCFTSLTLDPEILSQVLDTGILRDIKAVRLFHEQLPLCYQHCTLQNLG